MNYYYILLNEIDINLNSGNTKISYEKITITYFEWHTDFRYHLDDLGSYEIRK